MMESKMVITMCVYCSMAGARDKVSTIQRTEAKNLKNGFLNMSYDTSQSAQ